MSIIKPTLKAALASLTKAATTLRAVAEENRLKIEANAVTLQVIREQDAQSAFDMDYASQVADRIEALLAPPEPK